MIPSHKRSPLDQARLNDCDDLRFGQLDVLGIMVPKRVHLETALCWTLRKLQSFQGVPIIRKALSPRWHQSLLFLCFAKLVLQFVRLPSMVHLRLPARCAQVSVRSL